VDEGEGNGSDGVTTWLKFLWQSVKAPELPKRYQRLFLGLLTIMIAAIVVAPHSPLFTHKKVVIAYIYLF
jgi:hypothetical protein